MTHHFTKKRMAEWYFKIILLETKSLIRLMMICISEFYAMQKWKYRTSKNKHWHQHDFGAACDFIFFICLQVNSALNLNQTKRQWVDLEIHTDACMTRPETCGAAGGAISLWVNAINCSDYCGFVSSAAFASTGSSIFYHTDNVGWWLDHLASKYIK